MPTLPKKLTISDFSYQELYTELGRQYKNLSSTLTKLSKDADTCNKALSNIADDLCPIVCSNLISAYSGLKSSSVKISDGAIASAIKPVQIKFNKYCGDKYSCNYEDKEPRFAQRSSEDEDSYDSTRHDSDDEESVEMSGEAHSSVEEL
jgi:hypothetical protein